MVYAESAMGEKLVTVASSPFSAAVMIRLYRRSNLSRGDMLLMSGGGPPPAAAPSANGALAAASAAGAGAPRGRKINRSAMTPAPKAPVSTQRTRSPVRLYTPPVGRPQPEQNCAPTPRGAPQPAQGRATRLAPQLPQNFPEAGAPQAGQTLVATPVIGWCEL